MSRPKWCAGVSPAVQEAVSKLSTCCVAFNCSKKLGHHVLRIVMGRQSLSVALLCLLPLFILSVRPVCGQAVVCNSRELLISASYEDVLARMDGEEASRAMFASQKLQMTSYKPQPKDKAEKAEEGVTKGKIDIVGVSCEFGTMCYLMSVRASEKETVRCPAHSTSRHASATKLSLRGQASRRRSDGHQHLSRA